MPVPTSSGVEALFRVLVRAAESPDRIASVLDAEGDALLAFTPDRVVVAANTAAERLFGYGRHELDGRSTDIIVPERFRQHDAPPMTVTADLTGVQIPALRKDGAELDVTWTFGSVPHAETTVFLMVVEDRARAAIETADEHLQLLADTMPVLAWYADPDGSVPWHNRRWADYTGKTLEELAGWGWQSVHDPADLPRILAKWRAALASGEPWDDEFRLRRHDGQMRRFVSRAAPLRDASSRIVRWFGTNVDVEETMRASDDLRRDARAELRASEERFHQLVDAIRDYAVFMLDANGCVVTWNPGARHIKGYAPDEILGRHFSVFYTPEDREKGRPDAILATVRREGRFAEEGWRVRKDGSRFWASVVITALRTEGGAITGFAKVTRDLTEKRAAEEKAHALLREQIARAASERASQELARLNRTKDEFLATMSHELRTPLNAIHGWATILRRRPRDEKKLEQGLETIERNAKAQTKLIDDLLDLSRIITGKLRLAPVPVDLYPLVVTASDVVKPAAEAKGVRLAIDVEPSVGTVVADPERIQQVLWNLLTNAVRFTPAGGVVTVAGARRGPTVVLQVRDTGAGIAAEHLPHLFERFMQVDSSTTRVHGGLGLGLAIVRHLAEAHGGTVEASSEGPGRGATFTVQLPSQGPDCASVAVSEADGTGPHSIAEPAVADAGSPRDLEGIRALVVENDPDSLELLRTMLEERGARVTPAPSARAALAAFDAASAFDVVVSDVGMPEVDGYALMRAIRSLPKGAGVPAVALTAYASAEDAARARAAGFQMHLAKPIEEGRLLDALRALTPRAARA